MMSRVMFSVGGINIYWYSFLILVAVFLGISLMVRYAKRVGINVNLMIDMIIYTIPIAIVGARIYYVVFNFDAYRGDIISIFKIWEGGLAIYGAVIASVLYIMYYCRKRGLPFIKVLDGLAMPLLLGQAIGRWGNFFNQEAYGVMCTREFLEGLHLPNFIIEGMYIDGSYYQPAFLYESLWCFLGVIIMLFIRKRSVGKVGKMISFYLIWYGLGRMVIESIRMDSLYLGSYRISQIVSGLLVVIGVVGYVIIFFKGRDKVRSVGDNDGRI